MTKRESILKEIEIRVKETVIDHADCHGWSAEWSWDWRLDDAENILGDVISYAAPRDSYLSRWVALTMIRRYWRAGRLAAAFDAALTRAV